MGRCRQIIEWTNGTALSTNKYLWVGTELSEERDASGANVTKRFFGQGEQIGGTNYYFTRDHLGSVREMTDGTGTIRARYDYDPYGRTTKVSGDLDADFGFTGHYYHARSGLYLALYRAYDSDTGRWISKDPSGEQNGLNLYGYCGSDPLNSADALGLVSNSGFAQHHDSEQQYAWEFSVSNVNVHDKKWGTLFPAIVHDEVHARGCDLTPEKWT